jgi:hypothetical protein
MIINMKSDTRISPIACNMDVFTPAQRDAHIQEINRLFQTVQSVREAENGYVFILPGQTSIQRLGEFIANERLCCPFLEFTLNVGADTEPVSLLLTGPEGTQDFLRAEFSKAFP